MKIQNLPTNAHCPFVLQMKVQTEIVKESLKQESLLARDFDFAFYKKVTHTLNVVSLAVRRRPTLLESQSQAPTKLCNSQTWTIAMLQTAQAPTYSYRQFKVVLQVICFPTTRTQVNLFPLLSPCVCRRC